MQFYYTVADRFFELQKFRLVGHLRLKKCILRVSIKLMHLLNRFFGRIHTQKLDFSD